MKSVKKTSEFKSLELRISEISSSPHTIYFKEHSIREQSADKPSGRTLFVVNVPPYVDIKGISNAFSEAGNIISVSFSLRPSLPEAEKIKFLPEELAPSFRVAYIVFEKVAHLDAALKLKKLRTLNFKDNVIKCGMTKWIENYNNSVYQPKVLKEKIEEYMKYHDKQIELAEKKDKELAQEDDEGWVTVTKRGKVQSFARTEKVENKIMAKEEMGKKKKELKNFYTFQIRESKMKHIVALRQKFEEDKKKIAQIKLSRRFKPF